LESSTSKDNEEDLTILPKSITGVKHRMTEQVEEKVTQYAKYIFEPVDTTWALAHEDGDMKVYRRELEENGIVVDPLRAQFTVKVRVGMMRVVRVRSVRWCGL
jgi:collagen type IV alpha-3-binding protein